MNSKTSVHTVEALPFYHSNPRTGTEILASLLGDSWVVISGVISRVTIPISSSFFGIAL